MEFLVILVGFIALFLALNARKGVASLQLQLNGLLARLSRLEDDSRTCGDTRRPRPPWPRPPEARLQWLRSQPPAEAVTPQPSRRLPSLRLRCRKWLHLRPRLHPRRYLAGRAARHALGGMGRRPRAGARRPAAGALLDRAGHLRPRRAGGARRPFSLALVAAGEWFRRTERGLPVEAIPAAHVPSILTAAGTASAFGTVYAAHALYGFIGPAAAFVLLGIIGVATMLAAALHGPALAGLGLAGSLVVPMLVSSQTPSPWPLVIYLGVVAAAAYALARCAAGCGWRPQWSWACSSGASP